MFVSLVCSAFLRYSLIILRHRCRGNHDVSYISNLSLIYDSTPFMSDLSLICRWIKKYT